MQLREYTSVGQQEKQHNYDVLCSKYFCLIKNESNKTYHTYYTFKFNILFIHFLLTMRFIYLFPLNTDPRNVKYKFKLRCDV